MSDGTTGAAALQQEQEQLDAQQVCDYLESHPAFFIENEALLEQLRIPHHRGKAISLVERQVEVLRKRISSHEARLARLISTGRENEKLFEKTRLLTLSLLDAGSIDEIRAAIEDGFREHFGTDACSLVLVREAFGEDADGVRTVLAAEVPANIPAITGMEKACGGAFPPTTMEFLFPLHEKTMESAMVAPLFLGASRDLSGLLVLGSLDRAHFSETLETTFLDYAVAVLSRALAAYQI